MDDCFNSLTELTEMVKNLKNHGLTAARADTFDKLIFNARYYLKTQFKHQVELHSRVASHCAQFACSAHDKKMAFTAICGEDHDQICVHCQSIDDMFKLLNGSLADLSELSEEKRKECQYIIKTAYNNVWNHKNHMIRTFIQSYDWSEKNANDKGPDVAYVTCDWGMK